MDRSYLEMISVITRPFREDLEPPGNLIRLALCGMAPIALLSCIAFLVIEPSEEYGDIRAFFWKFFIISSLISVLLYGCCAWYTWLAVQAREAEKDKTYRSFRE